MTIAEFFWSEGHIGWSVFSIIVFSVLLLVVADVVWRLLKIPFRNLLIYTVLAWMAGVIAVAAIYLG